MSTLYITDLDGTLLNPDICVSQKSAEILNMLIDKGMIFSVATARSQASVSGLLDNVDIKLPIVLLNGVFIYDVKNKKNLYNYPLDNNAVAEILSVFLGASKSPFMYLLKDDGIDLVFTDLQLDIHKTFYEKRKHLFDYRFYKTDSYDIPQGSQVVYFNLIDLYSELLPIYEKLCKIPGVSCAFYEDNYSPHWFLEVYSNNASKSNGAIMLKNIYKADKIVAFGDNHNDIIMFNSSDECYATSNAVDELKNVATGVIGANFEDGVAQYLLDRFKSDNLF
ncbi:MAG: HAD-IIB family hydrolase [Clostridia bacterium]|nr:HAD-IIB family hydrolase [Clostridia bacterium]